jgi:preprotein translocase SecE subunit
VPKVPVLPTIYKRNQGQTTRSLTAVGLGVVLGAICYLVFIYLVQAIPSSEAVTSEIHNAKGMVLSKDWPTDNPKFKAGTKVTDQVIEEMEKTGLKKWSVSTANPIPYAMYIQYCVPLAVFLVGAYFIFILVNKERFADFLIATESEMKKVSWSSKQELIGSTTVVIVTVVVLAVIIWLADLIVIWGNQKLGVY